MLQQLADGQFGGLALEPGVAFGGGDGKECAAYAVAFLRRRALGDQGQLRQLRRTQLAQHGKHGIRVNTVAPGNIIFPGGTWQERMDGPRADNWQRWINREVPMKRYGTSEEIAATILQELKLG